ncbi:hypothetical protein [Anoxybacteroides amylolyticum]|uniref:Uncharacterized protein n=1 Tax=Anoxybacteroides amylolyticum TaxID=294699 RepID=A0A160F7K3_9BACL|nr:hypothetical protein [Anoxybacillus amylolyticus]ANB62105.1 hypothetical protein GFC30_3227 [Anoxybacillus amylolyticus]
MSAISLSMDQNWKQAVEGVVKQIIFHYYQASPSLRSASFILRLINRYWKTLDQHLFDSPVHYYTVLVKTTDHLLHFLQPTVDCFLLFERVEYGAKRMKKSIEIDMAYNDKGKGVVCKFFLETDETFCSRYFSCVVAACRDLGIVLSKVEFYSLLTGERKVFYVDFSHHFY